MNRKLGRVWPVIAIAALAFNLRPVAVSVGPVLEEVAHDAHLAPSVAGFLTSLPTLCFAIVGAVAPTIARRFGAHTTIAVALGALIVGQLARPLVDGPVLFLSLSMLALAGAALANVLIPPLIRMHYPHRVGLATSVYSLSMAVGVTIASAATVPIAHAAGGWQGALTGWGIVAFASLLAWLPMLRERRTHVRRKPRRSDSLASVARTKLGWAIAIMFGLQSGSSYTMFGWLPTIFRSHGMSEVDAGFMLGIATGVGIPLAFVIPAYVSRTPNPTRVFLGMMACLLAGWLGLLFAPLAAPWLWSLLLALGTATFPMILALFATRAKTASATTALSGFGQAVGYLIATACPFLFAAIHGWTDGWVAPLVFMIILVVPFTLSGLYSCQPRLIEDELADD